LYYYYYQSFFKKAIEYHNHIKIHAISESIKQKYIEHGFLNEQNIRVLHNGAREDLFRYTQTPKYPQKSIYVAKVERRKRQYKYQKIPNVVFVGNYQDSPFDITSSNYLGEWDKPTLYQQLTEYANLVLLSEGEADPLVVKEGLMAGLGVVISSCASTNLDLSKPFITVIPDEKLDDIEYVTNEIERNRAISISHRMEIRKYALEHFAWNKIIYRYIKMIRE
jgi:glycosyltransferase involved in cell wall biosynthesis